MLLIRVCTFLLLGVMALLPSATAAPDGRGFPPRFFAMDNGVGRGVWTAEHQAAALRELGFDGISYNYTNVADLRAWQTELARRELKLFAIYFAVALEGESPLPDGFADAVDLLRGTETVLWMIIPAQSPPDGYKAMAVERMRTVADLAARAGLRLVLYPHFQCVPATAEEALEFVGQMNRPNVALTLNLSHELVAGNGPRLHEIARRIAPHLAMVSINGATDQPGPLWRNYIQPLGQGDYDVGALLRTLKEAGYTGPVGLQSYAIEGEPKENLAGSLRAWRALRANVWPSREEKLGDR